MNETKFNGLGKIYSRYRPTYPKTFIDYLHFGIGISKGSIIADIGSGTGILTRQLLDIGKTVFAVEPNKDMRDIAESDLNGIESFRSVNATAESTTLDDRSVDFITVAQAFHWFDSAKFKSECKRILKPNGKAILVWNARVLSAESVKDSEVINRRFCPRFEGFNGGMRIALYNEVGLESGNEFDEFFSGEYEIMTFQNDQALDLDSFIGRTLSASYALKESDEEYPAYIAALTTCFYKHAVDGEMIMPIVTTSYAGMV